MTSPSAGDSPIEVSTLRPPSTAHALAPLPRCSTTRSRSSGARPSSRAVRRDDLRVGAAVEAVAAHRVLLAPRPRDGVRVRRRRQACGGTRCRRPRRAGCRGTRPAPARSPRRWRGCAAGASGGQVAQRGEDVVVDQHRVGEPARRRGRPGARRRAGPPSSVGPWSASAARARANASACDGLSTGRSSTVLAGLVVQVRPRRRSRTPAPTAPVRAGGRVDDAVLQGGRPGVDDEHVPVGSARAGASSAGPVTGPDPPAPR